MSYSGHKFSAKKNNSHGQAQFNESYERKYKNCRISQYRMQLEFLGKTIFRFFISSFFGKLRVYGNYKYNIILKQEMSCMGHKARANCS